MKKYRRVFGAILSIVMAIGLMTGGGILSVFGAGNVIAPETTGSFYVPASVSYMDKEAFTLAADQKLVITAPNGKVTELTDVDSEYSFTQIGAYSLVYKTIADKTLYSKTVYCELDAEYELRVAFNGADIPTYYAPNKEFKIPSAELYYKTEDMDDFEPLAKADYALTITTTDRAANATVTKDISTAETYKYAEIGSYVIVYSARLNGGDRYFTKTFDNIMIQGGDFKDEVKPKLTVVGVPTTASLNTKITLPKATATDDYDKNAKVNVSVQFKAEGSNALADVKVATVDKKTGFATGIATDAKAVVFDNVYSMSFYPTEKGRYEITYYSEDDFGNISPKSPYVILCTDRSAPTLIDIAEWQIPSRWGLSVYQYDENEKEGVAANTTLTFPYPEYADNAGADGILRVGFEIKDVNNSKTVLRIHDIYNVSGKTDNVYKYSEILTSNGYYQPDSADGLTFGKNGLTFDFKNYLDNEKHGEGFDGMGRYTIQYQARDKDQNITTKTYDITLEPEYKDLMPPDIAVSFDKYIYLHKGIKFYTVPTAVVTDAAAARINVDYTVSNAAGTESITVKNGEQLRVIREDAKILLANSDYIYAKTADEKSALSLDITAEAELNFKVTATDNVGNVKTYPQKAEDGVVKVIIAEEMAKQPINLAIDTDGISYTAVDPYGDGNDYAVNFGGIAATLDRNTDKTDTDNYNKFNLGSFAITGIPDAYRNFVGFELKLSGAKGIEDIDSIETFYINGEKFNGDAANGMIVVDNIRVALSKGEYTFTIRAFDINGQSVSASYLLTVDDDAQGGGIIPSSAPIAPSGQVNETYTLKNEFGFTNVSANFDAARAYMIRKISGPGNFTLMGSEFTAYAQGSFVFEEGFYLMPQVTAPDVLNVLDLQKGAYKTEQSVYDFDVNDTQTATFEVQGVIPVYSEKKVEVQLPSVVAHNKYANAVITVVVKDPDDRTVETVKITDVASANYNGYKFTPNKDGKYKVTYSASINNSKMTDQTYIIVVGDNIAPTFTVDKPAATVAIKTYFKFDKMVIAEGSNDIKTGTGVTEDNKLDNITFTKNLILPSGEVYSIKDIGKTGAEKEMDSKYDEDGGYQLTVSGEYKIEYIAEDTIGNRSIVVYEFSIAGSGGTSQVPVRIIATVLVIVAVLLLAGALLYIFRFQKKKIKK